MFPLTMTELLVTNLGNGNEITPHLVAICT